MTILAFVAALALAFGMFASVGVVYLLFRKRPQAATIVAPLASAFILPRPVPTHVAEGRILVNETEVLFNDDRELRPATIRGFHMEPGRGRYYHVTYPEISATGKAKTGRKWVPDTYVWEQDEVVGRAA